MSEIQLFYVVGIVRCYLGRVLCLFSLTVFFFFFLSIIYYVHPPPDSLPILSLPPPPPCADPCWGPYEGEKGGGGLYSVERGGEGERCFVGGGRGKGNEQLRLNM